MRIVRVVALCIAVPGGLAAAEELKLPPEVTPALRAACEGDVRRIGCLGSSPTYAKVKSCVIARYMRLGTRCKTQLALAGYSGPSNVPKSVKTGAMLEASAK